MCLAHLVGKKRPELASICKPVQAFSRAGGQGCRVRVCSKVSPGVGEVCFEVIMSVASTGYCSLDRGEGLPRCRRFEFSKGMGFDLANPFSAEIQLLADFYKGHNPV